MSRKSSNCTCEADDLYERQFLDDGRHFPDCPVLRSRIGATPDEIRAKHAGTKCGCGYCSPTGRTKAEEEGR